MFDHFTVLKQEAIKGLELKPDGIYVDCTLGGGGHSEQIVTQLTTGHLYAFDQDPDAIQAAKDRLEKYQDNITFIHKNFREIKSELDRLGVTHIDGILYDLGVSSPQFDRAERGFSYQHSGPLDMRMDQQKNLTARDIVNSWSYEDLVRIFFRYGEEKFSKQVARKIESTREKRSIDTTEDLVEVIKEAIPAAARRKGGHPAKRIFQAIRIAVNDELRVFEDSLEQAISLISVGGRIAVITFHSLEDRLCKNTFKKYCELPDLPPGLPIIPEDMQPPLKLVTRKPIVAGQNELDQNRRSRSAKLRIAEKIKPL